MAILPPDFPLSSRFYGALVRGGFRRSGELVYRTYCEGCRSCIPIRIPVDRFVSSRSQRRTWNQNQGLMIEEVPASFNEEHYRLYLRYQSHRHPGGDMEQSSAEEFIRFLGNPRFEGTVFFEFRRAGLLVAVSVVDVLDDGFSAVYTFYDPEQQARGLGTFAILWQIEEVRRRGGVALYLGFWIQESKKMAYKSQFRPYEILGENGWQDG
ncbi:MAG: putative arginyl-tRNA--protein transferase [Pseudomonadota bacterium]